MREIDDQVTNLAPVLNSRSLARAVVVTSDVSAGVDTMVKRDATATHLFAASTGSTSTTAHFELAGIEGPATAEVLGEQRSLDATDGVFADSFSAYSVHLYRIGR
jgi:hypothetical protein